MVYFYFWYWEWKIDHCSGGKGKPKRKIISGALEAAEVHISGQR